MSGPTPTAYRPGGERYAGAQNARTALAWRRTSLALCAATVALARVAFPVCSTVALTVLLLGVVGSIALARTSTDRYRARLRSGRGEVAAATADILLSLSVLSLLAATSVFFVLGTWR